MRAGGLTNAACAALLATEVIGALLLWAPIPLAWFWIGRQVGAATGSIAAAGSVTFLGFVATVWPAMAGLAAIDRVWVTLRRRAGHEQREGALTQVIVVSATIGLVLFVLWFYVLSGGAYVLPFMPTQ